MSQEGADNGKGYAFKLTCIVNWFMHPVARVSINKYRHLLRTEVSILID
jgi:hypothetical protein